MKKEECAVQYIESCSEEIDTKPFEASNPVLHTLLSAIVASHKLIADLKKAITEGDKHIISFLNERVYSKKSSIRDTIPKNKRINFSNDYILKEKEKANQMEKDGLISTFNLAEKSNLIDLVELFCNRVACECLATFNFDGSV